jgi:hypothetical protein
MVTRKKFEEISYLNEQALENNEITKQEYEKNKAEMLTHVSTKNYIYCYICMYAYINSFYVFF